MDSKGLIKTALQLACKIPISCIIMTIFGTRLSCANPGGRWCLFREFSTDPFQPPAENDTHHRVHCDGFTENTQQDIIRGLMCMAVYDLNKTNRVYYGCADVRTENQLYLGDYLCNRGHFPKGELGICFCSDRDFCNPMDKPKETSSTTMATTAKYTTITTTTASTTMTAVSNVTNTTGIPPCNAAAIDDRAKKMLVVSAVAFFVLRGY